MSQTQEVAIELAGMGETAADILLARHLACCPVIFMHGYAAQEERLSVQEQTGTDLFNLAKANPVAHFILAEASDNVIKARVGGGP